jgi:hypothetical protein
MHMRTRTNESYTITSHDTHERITHNQSIPQSHKKHPIGKKHTLA